MELARAGAATYRATPGEVHVWCVALEVPPEATAALNETLGEGERLRSARRHSARERQRFIVAHGALRELLGGYLGVEPGAVRFVHNAFGKPALSPAFGSRLRFNLSHSAGLALIAVAVDADVGIDVECVRWHRDYDEIARHFFSAAELAQLEALEGDLRARAFFACWTKKEAYVKACGEGLTTPLASFSVPLATVAGALPDGSSDGTAVGRWALYALHPAPGYVGALAIRGAGWRLTQRTWQMSA